MNRRNNKEDSNKAELVNDPVRQNQIDWIRMKLEKAEESGFTTETKTQILQQSKNLIKF